MKIALAQMSMSNDKADNYQKTLAFMKEAHEKGVDLIIFPEIQLSPFSHSMKKEMSMLMSIQSMMPTFVAFRKRVKRIVYMPHLMSIWKKMGIATI